VQPFGIKEIDSVSSAIVVLSCRPIQKKRGLSPEFNTINTCFAQDIHNIADRIFPEKERRA